MDRYQRPTADLVLLIMALVIALVVVLTGAGIFVLALVHPDYSGALASAFEALGGALGMLLGAILGYLAGRGRSPYSTER